MTLALNFPVRGETSIARIDPRWKLAAFLACAVVAAVLQRLLPALVVFGAALTLGVFAQIPWRWLVLRLAGVALVLAFFVAWLPFIQRPDETPWHLGWISLSPSGLARAALLVTKALAVVTLLLTLLVSSPLPDTFKAAHALHVPQLLVHLVVLTYRFLFVIADEFRRMRIALRVRGFRNRAGRHGYHTVAQVAGTLLVRCHERAERVNQALRCRGFDGCYRSIHDFRTRPADILFFAILVGCSALLLAWDILGR